MPEEYKRLKNMPTPFSDCPKCHEEFEPFLRGLVQQAKRWFWIGPRRDYCALICRSCKQIVGWETPPRACLSFEQITEVHNEYWNRKRIGEIYNSPSFVLEEMLKEKKGKQMAQTFRRILADTIYPVLKEGD